jgi:gluconate 5-dehydrogenase
VGQTFRLNGKTALVTGGYGGIGEAVSVGLCEAGARVAIAGRNADRAQACASKLGRQGHDTYATGFEVTSVPDIQRMVDEVADRFGHIDILVNCVGVNREQKAEEVAEDQFDRVVDVNLKGAMFQAQAVARHTIRKGTGGKQVHFGSVRSLLALRGRGYAPYCASKGGLAMLCKQLAAEWAPNKINVNMLAPTFVRTEQASKWLNDPVFYQDLVARIPLGRIAEPEDMVGPVLFLVSSASDFITGQTLYLDGGITATQ